MAFLSTPSARRATTRVMVFQLLVGNFYPRPPRGGRLELQTAAQPSCSISIHALREEGDQSMVERTITEALFLSTPSARRATLDCSTLEQMLLRFLSTPSARRATYQVQSGPACHPISIHALREGRRWPPGHHCEQQPISIHALREEGDSKFDEQANKTQQFLSTPSARRATYQVQSGPACHPISIHALREEGDAGRPAIIVSNNQFLSTPSARGRLEI